MAVSLALATLGGGCFWCLEASFEQLKGVQSVTSGYADGQTINPTYESVSTGQTGHAEVVQISYDPAVISYENLLNVFFTIHDPTTMNQQGHDIGNQYRSIILTHDQSQLHAAKAAIATINQSKKYSRPLVTQIEPLKYFYAAEDYHQHYFAKHPEKAYCQLIVAPKIEKVKEIYKSLLKEF
jgi:peptide-methionine (S)-S-oxide reductase